MQTTRMANIEMSLTTKTSISILIWKMGWR